MDAVPVSPPKGPPPSRLLPGLRAKDLLLPAAAVALGAFLAFGPYFRPRRSMKVALLTVPALASLVAFNAVDRLRKKAPGASGPAQLELKSRQLNNRVFLNVYRNYTTGNQLEEFRFLRSKVDSSNPSAQKITKDLDEGIEKAAKARDQLKTYSTPIGSRIFSEKFATDVVRDYRVMWFQEEISGTLQPSSWQLDLDDCDQAAAVGRMVQRLEGELQFSQKDVERLSWVLHQGPFGDIFEQLSKDYYPQATPREHPASHPVAKAPPKHVYKILYKGSELTALETQSAFMVCPNEDPENGQGRAVYVLAKMRLDFKTGAAEMSYQAVRTEDELAFE